MSTTARISAILTAQHFNKCRDLQSWDYFRSSKISSPTSASGTRRGRRAREEGPGFSSGLRCDTQCAEQQERHRRVFRLVRHSVNLAHLRRIVSRSLLTPSIMDRSTVGFTIIMCFLFQGRQKIYFFLLSFFLLYVITDTNNIYVFYASFHNRLLSEYFDTAPISVV